MTNRYVSLLIGLWANLTPRRRSQFLLLLVLSGVSAFAEMIGLGIIFPFLGVLASPENAMAMPVIVKITSFLGISSTGDLLTALTAALVITTSISCAIKLLLLWASARVSMKAAGDLSVELYRRALYQPYATQITRNSSDIIAGVGTKVSHSMLFLHQSSIMLSSVVILIALLITLVAIDPRAALSSAIVFGTAYILISHIVKKRLRRNGEVLSSEAPRNLKALQEGLGGIRDVLLDGTQPYYCELYADSNRKIRRAQSANSFINMAPRHVMEATGVSFIALLAYWLTLSGNLGQSAIPVLGALALGAQRMLPILQAIYGAWANILSSEASVRDTLVFLEQPLPAEALRPIPAPLGLRSCIRFESVDFAYLSAGTLILKDINLKIHKGERVGIVGFTGSGKSTVLDILMGLLRPSGGRLLVDDVPITEENSLAWRQSIAHVPQSIFLADASIAENIALGKSVADIDMDRVRRAASQAKIADIIESRSGGYFTRVGERGVKLSGGQRQRIAIARALYKNASILVLDEATSALDNSTEKEVMDAVQALDPELTIIIVAHRIASVKDCDRVIQIEAGAIVADGTFEAVLGRTL